jgi:hypothetical protein
MAGTQSGSPDSGFTETGVTNPPQSGEHNTKKKDAIFFLEGNHMQQNVRTEAYMCLVQWSVHTG